MITHTALFLREELVQDRRMLLDTTLIATAGAISLATIEVVEDTWIYGEAGNYCMAYFRQSPTHLVIRFSAKTSDDTLQIWREGLPSLTSGMNRSESEAAASRYYDLQLVIGDRTIPLTTQSGHLRPRDVPGRAYVLGVDDQRFVEALAKAPALEVRHRGHTIAQYRIAKSATLANRLASCLSAP